MAHIQSAHLRHIEFQHCYQNNDFPLCYSPDLLLSPCSWVINPNEQLLVTFPSSDSVYRFRTCCKIVQRKSHEQLCILIYNSSVRNLIGVFKHTVLSDILNHPFIDHRMIVIGVSELVDLFKKNNVTPIKDEPFLDLSINDFCTIGKHANIKHLGHDHGHHDINQHVGNVDDEFEMCSETSNILSPSVSSFLQACPLVSFKPGEFSKMSNEEENRCDSDNVMK